jgi:hypothetical protein
MPVGSVCIFGRRAMGGLLLFPQHVLARVRPCACKRTSSFLNSIARSATNARRVLEYLLACLPVASGCPGTRESPNNARSFQTVPAHAASDTGGGSTLATRAPTARSSSSSAAPASSRATTAVSRARDRAKLAPTSRKHQAALGGQRHQHTLFGGETLGQRGVAVGGGQVQQRLRRTAHSRVSERRPAALPAPTLNTTRTTSGFQTQSPVWHTALLSDPLRRAGERAHLRPAAATRVPAQPLCPLSGRASQRFARADRRPPARPGSSRVRRQRSQALRRGRGGQPARAATQAA